MPPSRFAPSPTSDDSSGDMGVLIGRLLLAALFVIDGWSKVTNFVPAGAYMSAFGVPSVLLPLVILTEVGGGLCLIVDWQTRVAALALAGFCIMAAILFHANFADRNQLLHFQKDLAIAGGLLALFACGPGGWSLDRRGDNSGR